MAFLLLLLDCTIILIMLDNPFTKDSQHILCIHMVTLVIKIRAILHIHVHVLKQCSHFCIAAAPAALYSCVMSLTVSLMISLIPGLISTNTGRSASYSVYNIIHLPPPCWCVSNLVQIYSLALLYKLILATKF